MNRNTRPWTAASGAALLFFAAVAAAAAQRAERKSVAVRHPNLLLNQKEIEQIKVKVREHAWAAPLLERVKAKAEKDDAVVEAALAYALTSDAKHARSVRLPGGTCHGPRAARRHVRE